MATVARRNPAGTPRIMLSQFLIEFGGCKFLLVCNRKSLVFVDGSLLATWHGLGASQEMKPNLVSIDRRRNSNFPGLAHICDAFGAFVPPANSAALRIQCKRCPSIQLQPLPTLQAEEAKFTRQHFAIPLASPRPPPKHLVHHPSCIATAL